MATQTPRARRTLRTVVAEQENDTVSDTATVEAPVTDTAATAEGAEGAEATANGKSAKNSAPIQLTVPLDLKAIIEAKAAEAGKSSARWILENIATDVEYTLAEPTRATSVKGTVKMTDVFAKDLSPKEKQDRLAAAKLMLDGLAKGVINLDDIKRQLGIANGAEPVAETPA